MRCINKCLDAFSFLAVIAPHYPLFWLGLGYAAAKCGEKEIACRVCEYAIELQPNDLDGYIVTADVFKEFNDTANARAVCERGLEHADNYKNDTWAQELRRSLETLKQSFGS